VSTTVLVSVFGVICAVFMSSRIEVMSATAAYVAVLVVFVRLITEKEAESGGLNQYVCFRCSGRICLKHCITEN